MSIIQDKLGNDFLRSNGVMDANFAPGMIMYLPPVTSFTRLAAHSVMQDLPPHEVILKKERDSPDCGGMGGGGVLGCGGGGGMGEYVHAMGIKQEKLTEHDYRLPLYPGGAGKGGELLEVSLGNHPGLLVHDLSLGNLPSRPGKESTGRRGRRSNGDGTEGKPRRKRGEAKQSMMLDADGGSLSPGTKPHICEHCNASFRSSYHLRRHVLIHTGERPYRCSQCNMSFIQKYLLQRHEKIHSGEKPFCCDQCNMRFIQKYHMERHKRTHSGEKPYRCETCQQYFSRTDRLLKHKRTCGEAIKKDLEPGMLGLGGADAAHGSYGITQGTAGATGRKRGRSKTPGEAGERKRKKAAAAAAEMGASHVLGAPSGGYALHDYSAENHASAVSASQPGPSMHQGHQGRAPKMAFKKANRKGPDKGAALGQAKQAPLDQGSSGFLQPPAGPKAGPTSSNYDDAMQFLKKRRYLHAANNAASSGATGGGGNDYDHQSVIQGVVTGAMDSETPLSLLDSSPMGVDKHDKSGIPDEVLQSLLEHYTHKADPHHDVHFDLGDPQHVELHPPPPDDDGGELGADGEPPSPSGGGDKTVIMHEYSRFLLQALERTSQTAGFPLGPSPPATGPFVGSSHPGNPLYADKNVYTTTSPLECGYGQSGSPSSSLPSSVPKSHFTLLSGSSPQHSFHLSGLDPQQLTPSQELTDQIDKQQHHPSPSPPCSYQISPSDLGGGGGPKEANGAKNGAVVYPLAPSQELASLDAASKSSYQIETFAQAFGAQFKAAGRGAMAYGGGDSNGEADHHRIRTPVSEFSGYSSLLADVGEPVSTGSKTPTSQSYR